MTAFSSRLRNRHFLALDCAFLIGSPILAIAIYANGDLGLLRASWLTLESYLLLTLPIRLLVNHSFGLYQRYWSIASIGDLERLITAAVFGSVVGMATGVLMPASSGVLLPKLPIAVTVLDGLLMGIAIATPRLAIRLVNRRKARWRIRRNRRAMDQRALIIGAGAAGQLTAKEIDGREDFGIEILGFIDDDQQKVGLVLADHPVLGLTKELDQVAFRTNATVAIIAMPSAGGSVIRDAVRRARAAGLVVRTVPSLSEMINRSTETVPLREVHIEDLLRREPITIETDRVRQRLAGRVVMVTGAGGSIGSELCRQIATMSPCELVIVGHGENSIFEIQQELLERFPSLKVTPRIADVRDREAMHAIVGRNDPVAIFHAAAHKHVPLMEANILEALRNNVVGTHCVVEAAAAHGVPHLVLISTDKAVRPTSVMGATKRVAEQIVQMASAATGRPYVSVRFGNVLGSRGSVVPTFLRQIRKGGPVTITHPQMRRYFMTIPEAVQLVLQAFVMGTPGAVYCLDMGEPVRILDLAQDLIQLVADHTAPEVEVRFTGSRPGEKLYEEMFFGAEDAAPTTHPKVLQARHASLEPHVPHAISQLLHSLAGPTGDDELLAHIERLVEDFRRELAPQGQPMQQEPVNPKHVA
jgi:FlaA1/EpsC-like NDP-sugar epimerase